MVVSEIFPPPKALNPSPFIAITGVTVYKSIMPIPIVAYVISTIAKASLSRLLFG
jgi:hypothetical protein